MTGAAQAPFLLLVGSGAVFLVIGVAIELLLSLVFGGHGSAVRTVSFLASVPATAAVFYLGTRFLRRVRLVFPLPLDSPLLLEPDVRALAGEKSALLAHCALAGLPVPPGWAVLARGAPAAPPKLAKLLRKRFLRMGSASVLVRSSFPDEDREHLFPGVFFSSDEVALGSDATLLAAALQRVAKSYTSDLAAHYRQRRQRGAQGQPEHGGMLVQEFQPCDLRGTACSFHPPTRRIDLITLQVEGGGSDLYNPLSGIWIRSDAGLSARVRAMVLGAIAVGEQALQAPVVVEFGVAQGDPFLFQVRKAPATKLEPVWTSGGPVGLNPEVLPPLFRDIVYGANGELVERAVRAGLGIPDAEPLGPAFYLEHLARPLVDYRALVPWVRYRQQTMVFPQGLLQLARTQRRLQRRARAWLAPENRSMTVEHLRAGALLQGEVQGLAERWRSLADRLTTWLQGVPGNRFAAWLLDPSRPAHRSRQMARLRNQLHDQLLADLAQLAGPEPLAPWLRLTEWQSKTPVPQAELLARQEATQAAAQQPAPFVHTLAPELPAAQPSHGTLPFSVQAGGTLQLTALVEGEVTGRVVVAGSSEPTEGCIVLLRDMSLQHTEDVLHAAAMLMVGQGLLSHLCLLVLEAGTPTLIGLQPEWAAHLAGRTVTLSGSRLIVHAESQRTPDHAAR